METVGSNFSGAIAGGICLASLERFFEQIAGSAPFSGGPARKAERFAAVIPYTPFHFFCASLYPPSEGKSGGSPGFVPGGISDSPRTRFSLIKIIVITFESRSCQWNMFD